LTSGTQTPKSKPRRFRLTRLLSLALVCLLFVAPLVAQRKTIDDYERQALSANEALLEVSIATDRKIYFPGEKITVELAVTNPKPSALKVRDPFDVDSAAIDLQKKSNKSELGWEATDAVPRSMRLTHQKANITFHLSSQRLTRTLINTFWLPGDPGIVAPNKGGPSYPDDYRLRYFYGRGATAEFTVIPAKLEAYSYIVLQRKAGPLEDKLWKKTYYVPYRYGVIAVGGDGAHWACVSGFDGAAMQELQTGGFLLPSHAGLFSPVIRIARSDVPIKSITGLADAQENLTITWTDANGKSSTIRLDQNKKDSWGIPTP
jgi:hypothetical protein